jgi:hypothetical protein
MITIFSDFHQFQAKKLAFFLNNAMIQIVPTLAIHTLSKERQFLAKLKKEHNIGPR